MRALVLAGFWLGLGGVLASPARGAEPAADPFSVNCTKNPGDPACQSKCKLTPDDPSCKGPTDIVHEMGGSGQKVLGTRTKLLATAPGSQKSLLTPEELLASAAQKAQAGDFKGVIAETDLVLKQDPENAEALRRQGDAYARLRQNDAAEPLLKRALAKDPQDAAAWQRLSSVSLALGKPQEALESAERAVSLDANDAAARVGRAAALESLGRRPEALKDLEAAASLDPRYEDQLQRARGGERIAALGDPSRAPGKGAVPPWLPWVGGAALGAAAFVYALVVLFRKPAPAQDAAAQEAAPQLLVGRYRPVKGLGRDRFGMVFQADDLDQRRPVTLKALTDSVTAIGERREAFLAEARALVGLRHPAIVELYDVVEDGPIVYLAFEPVAGKTAAQLLAQSGPLGLAQAAALLMPVCEALDHAHAQGRAHRDLKLGNIVLAAGGQVKLVDFGIAGALASAAGPEADIHALGACLYELVTGTPPFPADSAERDPAKVPPASSLAAGLSRDFDGLISDALAADPAKRLKSAASFGQQLVMVAVPNQAKLQYGQAKKLGS